MSNPILIGKLKLAIGVDGRCSIMPPRATDIWVLRSLAYIPNDTSAANDTNYATIRPYKGTGTGTPLAAARPTTVAGGALTAGTAEVLALTAVGADLEITQANPLTIQQTHTASGIATDLEVVAEFEWQKRGA